MADFAITGADDFLRLSKALKAAGATEMRKALHKSLRDAAKPLTKETQQALADAVPPRLKSRAAKTAQTVQVSTGRDPGVRILKRFGKRGSGLSASNARLLNQGKGVRHPVFDNREVWATTPVPAAAGWFDDTLEAGAPKVRRELEAAMEDVARQVLRGL